MQAAVGKWAIALQFAAPALRDDRDIVLRAVRKWGVAIKHASERLRADREIVLIAVKRNSAALKYASAELRAELRAGHPSVRQLGTGAVSLSRAEDDDG